MTIAFRAAGALTTGTISVTPPLPAGHAANDILVVLVASLDNGVHSVGVAGYTQIGSQKNNTTGLTTSLWWKRDGGSESAPAVNNTGVGSILAVMAAYSGCTQSGSPVNTSSAWLANTSSTTASSTGLTTGTSAAQLIECFCTLNRETWSAPSGSPTPAIDVSGPNTNGQPSLAICDSFIAVSGTATGTRTITMSTGRISNGIQFALIPANITDTAGTLSLSATITAAGAKKISAAAGAFTPALSFAAAGKKATSAAAGVIALTATPAEAGIKKVSAAVSLSLTATFSEAGRKATSGAASLALSASFAEAGRKAISGAASLSMAAVFAGVGTKAAAGAGALAAAAGLSEAGSKNSSGAAALSAVTALAEVGAKAAAGALGAISLVDVLAGSGFEGAGSALALTLGLMFALGGRKGATTSASIAYSALLEAVGSAVSTATARRRVMFDFNDDPIVIRN